MGHENFYETEENSSFSDMQKEAQNLFNELRVFLNTIHTDVSARKTHELKGFARFFNKMGLYEPPVGRITLALDFVDTSDKDRGFSQVTLVAPEPNPQAKSMRVKFAENGQRSVSYFNLHHVNREGKQLEAVTSPIPNFYTPSDICIEWAHEVLAASAQRAPQQKTPRLSVA